MASFNVSESFSLANHCFKVVDGHFFRVSDAQDATLVYADYDLDDAAIGICIDDGNLQVGEVEFDGDSFSIELEYGKPCFQFEVDTAQRAGIGIDDLRDAGREGTSPSLIKFEYKWYLEEMPIQLSTSAGFCVVKTEGKEPSGAGKMGTWFVSSMQEMSAANGN
jgi:hypothetical protein